MSSRGFIATGVAVLMLSATVLLTILHGQEDEVPRVPEYSRLPTVTGKVELTSERDVVPRLQEILHIREEAYRTRNPEMLRYIYSQDCPCLASDERAINELVDRNHVWSGIGTSIDVRSERRISERLWVVTAIFSSSPLRVEKEDGELVHTEPAGSDLFQFTLVKPRDADQWLLGLATVLEADR